MKSHSIVVPSYTTNQTATLLAVHPMTVKQLIGSRKLGSVLIDGRRLVPRDELLAYLMDQIRSSKAWEQAATVLSDYSTSDETFDATLSDAHGLIDLYTRLAAEHARYQGDDETSERLMALVPNTARGQAH